jgi:hypothetical protein
MLPLGGLMSSIPFDTDSGCVVVFPLFAKPNPQTLLTNMPSLTKSSRYPEPVQF